MFSDYQFSNKIASLQPSAIREILKYTFTPGVISFAAGNPAPETFPVEEARKLTADILAEEPITALQYGGTEGYQPLIDQVKALLKSRNNIGADYDEVIITSGAEQVMDLVTKVLCNEGDTVICESPSFIGSLNAFRAYGCNLVGVPMETDGIDTVALEKALQKHPDTKFIYVIPNFQNPTGYTMSVEKRKRVLELAKQYGTLVLEDNPYGELRVEGETLPDIKSFDTTGQVIYAGTFSKIFSPGIRVGYVCAQAPIVAKMTVGKQTSDVHTPMLNQMLVSRWLKEYDLDAHLKNVRQVVLRKRDLMCDLLEEKFSDFLTFTKPEGGLFVWCKIPEGVNMPEFCKVAVQKKVAVVPGNAFLIDESEPCQYIRLNYTTPTDEDIVKGIDTLETVIKEYRHG